MTSTPRLFGDLFAPGPVQEPVQPAKPTPARRTRPARRRPDWRIERDQNGLPVALVLYAPAPVTPYAAHQAELDAAGPTQTTEDAMALLRGTRRALIDLGRETARELLARHPTTHSREVRDLMQARGQLDPTVPDFWLGVVFRHPDFVWTGQVFLPPVPAGTTANVHAWRPVKVWARAGVDAGT